MIKIIFTLYFLITASIAEVNCYLRALNRLKSPINDSAVELELEMNAKVLSILTTENGKVSGLFISKTFNPPKIPQWFVKWANENHYSEPGNIIWEDLPNDIKLKLLQSISVGRNFNINRTVPGLRVKEKLVLNFGRSTTFLGKKYKRGSHLIDVSSVLSGPVEYRGPDDIKKFTGIELHFRGNQRAGTMSKDAGVLIQSLGLAKPHQHIHIVTSLPIQNLKDKPAVQVALMGDFYRRLNLAAEMLSIMEEGGGITSNIEYGIFSIKTYFDSLNPENLEGVTQYFLDVSNGANPKIGDAYKFGWVGFRGSDKYDAPGLWGIEFRSISGDSDDDLYKEVLDGIQKRMTDADYGVSEDEMEKWLKVGRDVGTNSPRPEQVPRLISRLWYNRSWSELYQNAPMEVKQATGLISSKIIQFQSWNEGAREYKMLFHNWSNDPLFITSSRDVTQKIVQAQVNAIRRIKSGEPREKVMADFLSQSGLYNRVMNSIGVAAEGSVVF